MQPLLAGLSVGAPFAGAALCLALRDRFCRPAGVLAAAVAAAAAALLASGPDEAPYLFGAMPWLGEAATRGQFGCLLDPIARAMLLVCTIIGLATAVYSAGYLTPGNRDHPVRSGQARYYFWLMAFVGSMAGIALSPTLLQLLVFWEMTTVCSWALISFYDSKESLRAGIKALVMTSLGSLFFIGGLVWVFSATGSMDFDAPGKMAPAAGAAVLVLFLVAAWAKSAQVPFHTWLPDAMAAPTPISAYLHAAAMVKAGVFLIARLLLAGWAVPPAVGFLISIAALVTMFAALYFYFFQDDLKRLLAYSTIAQLGFIFLALGIGALGSATASRGAVLHIMMHACAKTTLFLTAGVVAYARGTRSINALSGLARTMPLAAAGFFVGAFALTGVPPLACFWSKIYVLAGALQVGGAIGPLVLILVLAESLIAFGWFLWVGQKVFFGAPREDTPAHIRARQEPVDIARAEQVSVLDPPRSMDWVLVGMIVLTLAAPLAGIPLVSGIAAGH